MESPQQPIREEMSHETEVRLMEMLEEQLNPLRDKFALKGVKIEDEVPYSFITAGQGNREGAINESFWFARVLEGIHDTFSTEELTNFNVKEIRFDSLNSEPSFDSRTGTVRIGYKIMSESDIEDFIRKANTQAREQNILSIPYKFVK